MPDIIHVISRRWKLILGLSLLAAVIAFLFSLLSPKKYLSTATALPVNVMTNERSRIFSDNIEVLYSDFGTPDELDKIEGTAALDTIYMATVQELNLGKHYEIEAGNETQYNASLELRKNSKVTRSGYGELKVKVWDKDNSMAAQIANVLLQKIQQLHQQLQNANSKLILERLKNDYQQKQAEYISLSDSASGFTGAAAELWQAKKLAMLEQVQQYEKLIDQYRITINSNPQVLLTVETAKPSLWPDKPKVWPMVLLALFAGFVFAFLLSVFLESRKPVR